MESWKELRLNEENLREFDQENNFSFSHSSKRGGEKYYFYKCKEINSNFEFINLKPTEDEAEK
jgi:hypothetical protein